jgi:hypothetical protein
MAPRRPRKSGARRGTEKGFGWFAGLGLIFITTGIIAIILLNKPSDSERLGPNLCRTDSKPTALISIVIDATDSISELNVVEIKRYVERKVYSSDDHTLINFYEISDSGKHIRPFSMCKPPSGKNVSELWANPDMLKEQFQKNFVHVFDATMTKLLTQKPSDQSPIIESFQSVAVEAIDAVSASDGKQRHHIIFVSDLLQHSSKFSFYREKPSMRRYLEANSSIGGMFAKLNDAEVTVLIVPRKIPKGAKSDLWEFWADWLERSNASKKLLMEPLS